MNTPEVRRTVERRPNDELEDLEYRYGTPIAHVRINGRRVGWAFQQREIRGTTERLLTTTVINQHSQKS